MFGYNSEKKIAYRRRSETQRLFPAWPSSAASFYALSRRGVGSKLREKETKRVGPFLYPTPLSVGPWLAGCAYERVGRGGGVSAARREPSE